MIEASYKIIKYNDSILLIIGEKFKDTLPREELLFGYTKSVKNGTIFDRTGLDEVEDIFLERERK